MLQKTSLKKIIALGLAVNGAGFKFTNKKSVATDDGECWQATLEHDRNKIVSIFNGGFGGENETTFHATTPAAKAAHRASLVKLCAVPEVLDAIRDHLIHELDMDREYTIVSDADYEERKAEILSATPEPTQECIEFLMEELSDITGFTDKVKRATKTKLVVALRGDDAKCQYRTCKVADTPENRAKFQVLEAAKFDYFVNDLFDVPNQSGAGK